MSIIDAIPKICSFFPKVTAFFLNIGMILVSFYHVYYQSPFFNTAFEDARGIERIGNFFLIPSQYLCEGKVVSYDQETDSFETYQRFEYETHKRFFTPIALTFFTPGTLLGAACKGLSFLSPKVKEKHQKFKGEILQQEVSSNNDHYLDIGIEVNDWMEGELFISQGYKRKPGAENNLKEDKDCLREIAKILHAQQIPFWVDCGTCIGVYRHGGVIPWDNDLDLSVLVDDFQNVMTALKKLDPKKFVVQDWSSRSRPGSYIRVYVKKNRNHIDIYMNDIDPEEKTITYIIAHENSHFMAEGWKERERTQKTPIPFDVIFPLRKGEFDGIAVPVPNQAARFLTYKYGPNLNPPRIYNEETGEYEKDLSHPYWEIPLVH
ncbi:MAG: LicD family protein [Chlamydiales bacterium]|nr:LicD family protein [Chlamydiales bacterium]